MEAPIFLNDDFASALDVLARWIFVEIKIFIIPTTSLIMVSSRVSLKTQNVSQRAPNGGYAVSICGGPLKKVSDFYLYF